MPYVPETMTYAGANKLARKIEAHWTANGRPLFHVQVIREGEIYVIRSNITFDRRGYPVLKREAPKLLCEYPE